MSHCCSSSSDATSPNKAKCPVNGLEYTSVSARTILHHIKSPWKWTDDNQQYYFCDDPNCDVVYFSESGTTISLSEIRTLVGVKSTSVNAPVCYCFNISKEEVAANPSVKDFVIEKTRLGLCSCETSNPSGRCCLKEFPRDESE